MSRLCKSLRSLCLSVSLRKQQLALIQFGLEIDPGPTVGQVADRQRFMSLCILMNHLRVECVGRILSLKLLFKRSKSSLSPGPPLIPICQNHTVNMSLQLPLAASCTLFDICGKKKAADGAVYVFSNYWCLKVFALKVFKVRTRLCVLSLLEFGFIISQSWVCPLSTCRSAY